MTLAEAMAALSAADKEQVERMLLRFGKLTALSLRAWANMYLESRLASEAWWALFESLLASGRGGAPGDLQQGIIAGLRPWVLQGPPLPALRPAVWGRAVSVDYFCRLLVQQGFFGSVESAKRNVRNMLPKSADVVAAHWRNFPLGKYLMWSTFPPDAGTSDPFAGMPGDAEGIRGVLGLDPNERDKPLLLLIYTLPPDVTPRFPTIAEAYAGDVWNYFFAPAPASADYGLTLPWPEFQTHAPRPEVVHNVIYGAQVAAPLRRVS